MILKAYCAEHYPLLQAWWKQWAWPEVPQHALPALGYVAYDGDEPLAAGFLYRTDSSLAWLEWLVANPNVSHERRVLGLERVTWELLLAARGLGATAVFSSAKHPTIGDLYERAGFTVTDRDMINWVRRV